MAIEIKKSTNEQYKDTLRMSKLQPFEYAILSKDEFIDPLEGEGQYGEWAKYNVLVHEYKTANPQTGEPVTETPNEVYGWFASGKSLLPKLPAIELGQKFKVTQVQVEGKSFSMYQVEIIEADGSLTLVTGKGGSSSEASSSTEAPKKEIKTEAPALTLDEKIKVLKSGGIDISTMAEVIAKEYDVTPEFVNKRAEIL